MSTKRNSEEKQNLHVRNKNRIPYDLEAMSVANPKLKNHIQPNKRGENSINFSDPKAVKELNTSILNHYYGIEYWEFPKENLCPPIPGRAEYIHLLADLLSESNQGKIPTGKRVTCLDIGTGASCIYPILGVTEYDWDFIASDIDPKSIQSAQNIVDSNPSLTGKVNCRLQRNPTSIFKGIIEEGEKIDIAMCNPPFHSSVEEALKGTRRKVKNLTGKKAVQPKLNFSGNTNELVYEGGEIQFIANMISESQAIAKSCFWFSVLVSKESNLKKIYKLLNKNNPSGSRTLKISTGNKTSTIIAWTFLTTQERTAWRENKWQHKRK